MRTANLAILFVDIPGFGARTSRQTLEENQRLLRTYAERVGPLFKAFGGRILKAMSDGFLVTFHSPTQALLSAAAVQDRLWQHNQLASEAERLEVRVAVNVGEVRVEEGDVFGEPVNVAARVLSLAEQGEVYFTEAVFLAMNKAEVPAEELGAYTLKGIPEPVRVYRVPHGPHRLAPVEAELGPQEAGPPFGHLGLARVPEGAARTSSLSEFAAVLGDTVEGLRTAGEGALRPGGGSASPLAGLRARAAGLLRPGGRRRLAGLLVVLVASAVGWGLLFGDPVLRAIDALEDAQGEERSRLEGEVRTRIDAVQDEARAAWYAGRLEEALGAPERAVGRYRHAARAGSEDARESLVDLLSHRECRPRAAAARALGELRVREAKGALEDLAEEGGPDDDDVPLFGCNSQKAARDALDRLE